MSRAFSVINPYTRLALGTFPYATAAEVGSTIHALKHRGLPAQAQLAPFQRSDILRRVATLLAERREAVSRTISSETGKTIRDARWETDRAVNTFIASSEEARKGAISLVSSLPRHS